MRKKYFTPEDMEIKRRKQIDRCKQWNKTHRLYLNIQKNMDTAQKRNRRRDILTHNLLGFITVCKYHIQNDRDKLSAYRKTRYQKNSPYSPVKKYKWDCPRCHNEFFMTAKRMEQRKLNGGLCQICTNRQRGAERQRRYKLTPTGRKIAKRKQHKRRQLGAIFLNSWRPGTDGHHIDQDHIVYIPHKLHQSIPHNVRSGKNMLEINRLAMKYINKISKVKKITPKKTEKSGRELPY